MKRVYIIIPILLAVLFASCTPADDNVGKIDISDAVTGESIATAKDLIEFAENGASSTANIIADIELGSEMLKILSSRRQLVIEGNGHTITGDGDCLIRLDDGCALSMRNVSLVAGSDGLGFVGDGEIFADNVSIDAVAHGINAVGNIKIDSNTSMVVYASSGYGITAQGLDIGSDSMVAFEAQLGAVNITAEEMTLGERSTLTASSGAYNAIKCYNTLVMRDGSTLNVTNTSEYHGAEIQSLRVEGKVTIYAVGGGNGVGLFIAELREDIYVMGSCDPEPRYENGRGRVNFVDVVPDPTPTPEATGNDMGEND